MSLFLSEVELKNIHEARAKGDFAGLYWGMLGRVQNYCEAPGLSNSATDTEWWHHAAEYVSEAALVCRLDGKNKKVASWLRSVTLELVRRGDDDWVGPFFRDHTCVPARGHLETAHLSIAVSLALDLCASVFTDSEREEIKQKLAQTAIPLCQEWLNKSDHLANWRCILLAGVAVPAAVLGDNKALDFALEGYTFCLNAIQPDGSYGESLQYSNYCYFGLMYTYESLIRARPELASDISLEPYAKAVEWFVHSYFYNKPLSGWGQYPVPRSANFNDSAANFGADPDLLMQISARMKDSQPRIAALARWMFDTLYLANPGQGPFDRNSFGFFNRYSFFSMIFYPQAAAAKSPQEFDLPKAAAFSNGNCLTRSSWDESSGTILAFSGAAREGLNAPGHLHADLNSFILVHNRERMLADPGHTCYRSLVHEHDTATKSHNTCTFQLEENPQRLQQGTCRQRKIGEGLTLSPLVNRKSKFLAACRLGDVTVFGADAAEAYGAPLEKFERFCLLCGEHALFVIDRIKASVPVITTWHWLLNNRDSSLEYKLVYPDRVVARRGNTGMKMFHLGEAALTGPAYGYIHDAYHPLPGQLGEGAPGSGLYLTWRDTAAGSELTRVHAIAVDTYGLAAGWHMVFGADGAVTLAAPAESWSLKIAGDEFTVSEKFSGKQYNIAPENGEWKIAR